MSIKVTKRARGFHSSERVYLECLSSLTFYSFLWVHKLPLSSAVLYYTTYTTHSKSIYAVGISSLLLWTKETGAIVTASFRIVFREKSAESCVLYVFFVDFPLNFLRDQWKLSKVVFGNFKNLRNFWSNADFSTFL